MSILEKLGFGPTVPEISPFDAHNGQKAGDIIIIDVRDPHEWAQTGRPQCSHPISMNDPDLVDTVKKLASKHPKAKITVSCKSGMRAAAAAKVLGKVGVENLAVLTGGIVQWNAEELPIDRGVEK